MTAFDAYQQGLLPEEEFGRPVKGDETWTSKNRSLSLQDRARRRVYEYVKDHLEKTDTHVTFGEDEVYVVWFAKTRQNWKALVSTTLPDGMYYEVTHDGDKQATYIDAYKKFDNVRLPD
jgi:hypothetical protein